MRDVLLCSRLFMVDYFSKWRKYMARKYPTKKDYVIVFCSMIFTFVMAIVFLCVYYINITVLLANILFGIGIGIAIGLLLVKKGKEWDKLSDKELKQLDDNFKKKFSLKKPLGIALGGLLGVATLGAVIGKGIASNVREYGDILSQQIFYNIVAFVGFVLSVFMIILVIYGIKSNKISD